MNYLVPAGLYAVGEPTAESPVVVTANYKMSYDLVRSALAGRDVWLLVLETFGINVWCAAGKGTFGTEEVVNRVTRSGLAAVVSHRRLILPLLGAPGVAAHEVQRRTGFTVAYGCARAGDLPAYLDNGQSSTEAMRRLRFNWYDRLVLIPVEIMLVVKSLTLIGAAVYLAAALMVGDAAALTPLLAYLGAVFTGIALAPLLLPLLPTRSFAVKGAVAGLAYCALLYGLAGGAHWSWTATLAAFLALPAISSFYMLNFTGCTTYTSRSGVKKEMRVAIPAMGVAVLAAMVLIVAGRFL